jgi:hypothetical protein
MQAITKRSKDLTYSTVSRPQDSSLTVAQASSPGPHASGASIQRPASTSTSRSFSGTHPGPSGSWQTQQAPRGSYVGLTNLPLAVPGTAPAQSQPGLTTWRSHESTQSVPSVPHDVHTPARNASSLPYNGPLHPERQHWPSTTPQYQYTVTEQQPHAQYQTHPQAPAQQHSPYSQAPVHTYPPVQHSQQQPAYHPPQMPPQSEFQNLSVSSSTSPYTVPAPVSQGFVPQQQYHIAPMQSAEYSQPQSHLPPQPLPPPSYHQPSSEQAYPPPPPPQQQQPQHSSVHYRDDSGRAYPVGHYPPA